MNNEWKKAGAMGGDTHDFDAAPEITGIYKGSRHNQGKKKNSTIHDLMVGDKQVAVWGTTVLDRKMEEVLPGNEVHIVRLGKRQPENGGNEYWDFDVEYREAAA